MHVGWDGRHQVSASLEFYANSWLACFFFFIFCAYEIHAEYRKIRYICSSFYSLLGVFSNSYRYGFKSEARRHKLRPQLDEEIWSDPSSSSARRPIILPVLAAFYAPFSMIRWVPLECFSCFGLLSLGIFFGDWYCNYCPAGYLYRWLRRFEPKVESG